MITASSGTGGKLLLTITTGGELIFSGRKFRFVSSNTLPTGLSINTDYWLYRASGTTYYVATTMIDSIDNTNTIAYTNAGTGNHELLYA